MWPRGPHGAAAGTGAPGDRAAPVAAILRKALSVRKPACAIVLGSGLGGLVSRMEGVRSVPFGEVGGIPEATVAGHTGAFISGKLGGREVLALSGRLHLYEGHDADAATLPVRVLRALDAQVLLLSNAAGGIGDGLGPGDLMVIADHLDFQRRPAARGSAGAVARSSGPPAYDAGLRALLLESATANGVHAREGVYAAVLGPSFETPAEIRMLARFGADAVGMSTVPEARAGHAAGMRVAAISCITNMAAGIANGKLSHEEVLATGRLAAEMFGAVVEEFVRRSD